MPRFMDSLNEVKAIRPDFSCLIGCEKILLPVLMMGEDGGTIATSSVAPEAVMKLYNCFKAGDFAESNRIQFKLLELIKTMFAAGNFPEGFREGVNLRAFNTGGGPQPMSPHEMEHFNAIRSKLACLLKECGFAEAAESCQASSAKVDVMLDRIRKRLP
jgi:dihydrodipicolinate synthase/N-acetylneuraminate lyase